MIGQTVSRYKVVEKLGSGGMGDVYKAEDTTLLRPVALKFLASHLLNDEEAKQRFLREARAAAAVTHSNVCHVYEVGEDGGTIFLAMAFIEGETLAARIDRGPMPIAEAVAVARQIAEGLGAAHAKGIVHRDVKPANVMIDAEGHATVMDFGLARLTEGSRLTRADQTVGTAAYMSPEQMQGAEVDHRTDVWALGCVLYEMAAGLPPFKGQYAQALAYEVVHEEPDPLTGLRTGVPVELELLVSKCLAKDRARRYQGCAELIVDLRTLADKLQSGKSTILSAVAPPATGIRTQALEEPPDSALSAFRVIEQVESSPDSLEYLAEDTQRKRSVSIQILSQSAAHQLRRRRRLGLWAGWAAALAATTVALWFSASSGTAPRTDGSLKRFAIAADSERREIIDAAISPDGLRIAYTSSGGSPLWLRDLDQEQPRALEGTEGAENAAWSFDSQFVLFRVRDQLKKVAVATSAVTTISGDAGRSSYGWAWSPDGESVIGSRITVDGQPPKLYEIPVRGGALKPYVEIKPTEKGGGASSPYVLPHDASAPSVLFELGNSGSRDIVLANLKTGEQRVLVDEARRPVYSPTGHVLYEKRGLTGAAVWALPFSLKTFEPTGEAFPIAQDAWRATASSDGSLLFIDAASGAGAQLVVRDRRGVEIRRIGQPQVGMEMPAFSPDGSRVAVRARDSNDNYNIWIHDVARGGKSRLTFDSVDEDRPIWSPDGKRITFTSPRNGDPDIFSKAADGVGEDEVVLDGPGGQYAIQRSLDGRYLIINVRADGQWRIDYLERQVAGGFEQKTFISSPFTVTSPRLSPNGRYLAYESDESGRDEIYVASFPDGSSRWQASSNGGIQPTWRRDGNELFYLEGDTFVAVPVRAGEGFALGNPERLFQSPWAAPPNRNGHFYDVSADGQQFLLVEPEKDEQRPASIHLVENWFEEFKNNTNER